MSGDDSEKTEEASPEKKRKARDEGQFARSKDAGAVVASGFVLLSLVTMGPTYVTAMHRFATHCFSNLLSLRGGDPAPIAHEFGLTVLWVVIPGALAAAVGGIAMGIAEAGFNPNLELIEPKWERLNPISKLQQLFSPGQGATNVLLALLRIVVVGYVTYSVLKGEFPRLARLGRTDLGMGVVTILSIVLKMSTWSLVALGVLAGVDYGFSWFRINKDLMMTRQEMKEEMHQQEGDPKIKAKIRARAREIARRGIAQGVRKADVIVANPTHISVAIRYRPEEGAPVVTAKGYDEVALYMRKLAKESSIPVIENRPLARALAEKVKVGRMIPMDLYQAVAQLLALVYRMKNRGLRG